MAQERQEPTPQEELVRAYGLDDEFNMAATKTVSIIEKALEAGGRINFEAFNSPPHFTSETYRGGMAGFNVDIGFLEGNSGEPVYREVKLGLRCTMLDVVDFPEFLSALEGRTLGWFECELDAVPELGEGVEQERAPTIFEDSEGRIILQGVTITDWREMEKEFIYPREPGSDKKVDVEDWNREGPFGYCPACGSVGMEFYPGAVCDDAQFYCSDETCRTAYRFDEEGRRITTRVEATLWRNKKPDWWWEKLRKDQFYSWNWTHFSPEFCKEHDLV
jgi:hypothetical protein